MKIVWTQYDGHGDWIDVRFSTGETFRFSKGALYRLGSLATTSFRKSTRDEIARRLAEALAQDPNVSLHGTVPILKDEVTKRP